MIRAYAIAFITLLTLSACATDGGGLAAAGATSQRTCVYGNEAACPRVWSP